MLVRQRRLLQEVVAAAVNVRLPVAEVVVAERCRLLTGRRPGLRVGHPPGQRVVVPFWR